MIISLTRGQVTEVCDCHYHLVKDYKWHAYWSKATKTYYAVRTASVRERLAGKPSKIWIHVVINDTPNGMVTDHWDGDSLNNKCSNLKSVTHQQNIRKQKKSSRNTSGYKGVYWSSYHKRWMSGICINGKQTHIGQFIDIENAARSYDRRAIREFGEFAATNFPLTDYKEELNGAT